MLAPEGGWRGNYQMPGGLVSAFRDRLFRLVEIAQQAYALFEVGMALFGQRQVPCRTVHQLDPHSLLTCIDAPAQHRGTDLLRKAGACQAAFLGDLNERFDLL